MHLFQCEKTTVKVFIISMNFESLNPILPFITMNNCNITLLNDLSVNLLILNLKKSIVFIFRRFSGRFFFELLSNPLGILLASYIWQELSYSAIYSTSSSAIRYLLKVFVNSLTECILKQSLSRRCDASNLYRTKKKNQKKKSLAPNFFLKISIFQMLIWSVSSNKLLCTILSCIDSPSL